jgi:hypothetical protein
MRFSVPTLTLTTRTPQQLNQPIRFLKIRTNERPQEAGAPMRAEVSSAYQLALPTTFASG